MGGVCRLSLACQFNAKADMPGCRYVCRKYVETALLEGSGVGSYSMQYIQSSLQSKQQLAC